MPSEIKVVIADDHPIFRRGLREVIETDPRLKVVGEADDGEGALARLRETGAEVAVLDIDMPNADGFEVVRRMREARAEAKVIFLTMHKNERFLNAALDLGVQGYILKDSAATELIVGIKAVAAGQDYLSPALSTWLVNRIRRGAIPAERRDGFALLTPTERRVLSLVAEGRTSREIAEALYISARTVEHHRANICAKLGLKGVHALIRFAAEHREQL